MEGTSDDLDGPCEAVLKDLNFKSKHRLGTVFLRPEGSRCALAAKRTINSDEGCIYSFEAPFMNALIPLLLSMIALQVNSVNIVRMLAQTVHYFWAYFRLADNALMDSPAKVLNFKLWLCYPCFLKRVLETFNTE